MSRIDEVCAVIDLREELPVQHLYFVFIDTNQDTVMVDLFQNDFVEQGANNKGGDKETQKQKREV